LAQIESCTHLFAWIDDITAYGTFNEIGYATGLKKKIYIGIDETKVEVLDQLWFTFESAQNIFVTACAGDAWHRMLNCIKSETKLTLPLNIR
jgi:nucleoside 2-deoxyribosyltransferase